MADLNEAFIMDSSGESLAAHDISDIGKKRRRKDNNVTSGQKFRKLNESVKLIPLSILFKNSRSSRTEVWKSYAAKAIAGEAIQPIKLFCLKCNRE
jgi:hypothetical protein